MESGTLDSQDFGRIAAALGPPLPVAYGAAHDYPTSAPAYTVCPHAEREQLQHDVLRLYVHIPFCNYHCTFCFFATRIGAKQQEMERYVKALTQELTWAEAGTPLSQVFVGGGTPTALPPELLDAVLSAIFARLPSQGHTIHTVETSPESITPAHIEVLRRHGIGRVSMGIQSLEDGVLDTVHRRHTAAQTLAACDLLVDSGLIVNVDLIYGLPGQTADIFRRDFAAIAARGVPAVTVYDLRLNERTPLARSVPDEERLELQRLVHWRLFVRQTAAELGFTQTRWHTFKRLDTSAARHERAPHFDSSGIGYQLGIGMSARSHLGHTIYRNHEHLPTYVERVEAGRSPVEQVFRLQVEDRKTQYVARSLGDGKPLHRSDYERVFGQPIEHDFGEPLRRLQQGGLIEDSGGTFHLTEVGKLVHDRVTFNFYPQRAIDWLIKRQLVGRNS